MKRTKQWKPASAGTKRFTKTNETQDLYKTKDWTDYRFRFLSHNRSCYCCPNIARVVDHITAHKGNLELFEKNTNHLPLCSSCHSTITQLFDRFTIPKTLEKLAWIKNSRERNAISIPVKVISYRK